MPTPFRIQHDAEFYVWLKASLPARFRIQSEPSSEYYSEWQFCYQLYDGEALLETIAGDFRELEPGELAQRAVDLLDELERRVAERC